MRKLLAVLMTVLMLASVLAVIPASAAEDTTYDGSTAANTPSLMITEISHNTAFVSGNKSDGFEFWEVYNAGSNPVNIYDYSMMMAPMFPSAPNMDDPYYPVWDQWATSKKFTSKLDIKSGKVAPQKPVDYNNSEVSVPYTLENDATAGRLDQGEFAILWFIKSSTFISFTDYMAMEGITNPAELNVRDVFKYHYSNIAGSDFTLPDDVNIIMVWGYNYYYVNDEVKSPAPDQFYGDDASRTRGFMYGLAKDSFNLASSAVNNGVLSSDIACLAPYGCNVDSWKPSRNQNVAAIYVPASSKPDYYIAAEADRKETVEAEDYFEAGLVGSYVEMGHMKYGDLATPGGMRDYQWAYVDPANAPAEMKTSEDWATKAISDHINFMFPDDTDLEEKNPENMIEVNPPTREELQNRYYPPQTSNKTQAKSGLPVGALIGIIAGGVAVVAGAAVAVIIIVKKKKTA